MDGGNMIDYEYISAFLAKVEGKCMRRGYIPCHLARGGSANYIGDLDPAGYIPMGASGVTIATGCDLGHRSAKEFSRWGLDPDIIQLYQPYLGLKKKAALEQLHQFPLTISLQSALETDRATHRGYLHEHVLPVYARHSSLAFEDLPRQAQAVIMSLCFHLGPTGASTGAPITFNALARGDWETASHELKTGFRRYPGRRRMEGQLLEELCRK